MVEANRAGSDQGYWGYLIKADKSAAPHLEQLCLGLARIICTLDGGPNDRLTPRRLAAFYRSVGGNLDTIFLRTSESGLSFLYRTLGCFHCLEATNNPFETPSIPCLTPDGFVKWQTVQLLLCPEEHVRYMQEAVRIYNVPRPDGGFFPKSIPKEAFPQKPDVDMEQWHRSVTTQLSQENYMRARLKNSPYHSPHPVDRVDGYFSPVAGSIPRIRKPSRSARSGSRDGEIRSPNSRRCSEPEFPSPINPVEHARNPHAYSRDDRRSVSAQRPSPISRQRSATTGHPTKPQASGSSSRNSERPPVSFYRGLHPERSGRSSRRSITPSSDGDTSADDASSEDSRGQRKSRASRAKDSLLSVLPFNTPWNKRSRSYDPSQRKDRPIPRKDGRGTPPPLRASTETFHRPSPSVRFRQDMFDETSPVSAPESQGFDKRPPSGYRPDTRYNRNPGGAGLTEAASPINYNLTKEVSSGSGSDHRSAYEIPARQLRKAGNLQRTGTGTVTGVSGRIYANLEQAASGASPPNMPPNSAQQDPRNQMRYSLAV